MLKSRLFIVLVFLLVVTITVSAVNRAAIIVGVNDYDVLSDLNAGVNDAEKMAAYYKGLGFKVWLLSDRQSDRMDKPSLGNFERVLDNVQDIYAGEVVDELVFFFAGHGVQIKGKNYLCFPEAEVSTETGMLSVDDFVVPWIKEVGASLNMVYLDACRNELGPMRAAGVERGLEVVGVEKAGFTGDIAIIYAAKPGSFSYEKPDGTNGFFTDTLLEALQSAETSNIGSLYTYLRTALPERTESAYGRPQIPHMGGDFDLTVSFSKGQVDLGAYDTTAKLFVESSIIGATIKINGIIRGEAPTLIEGINPGNVLVELEKDGLYASKQLTLVAKAFDRVKLELKKVTGDIVVNSLVSFDQDNLSSTINNIPQFMNKLEVWVDGEKISDHSSGLISSLDPGSRNIIIKGNGWYWEDQVTIEPNNAKKVNVELYPVGDFFVEALEGSVVSMKSVTDGFEIITDPSKSSITELPDMPTGVWKVSVSKKGYDTYTELVEILKGQKFTFRPEMNLDRPTTIQNELVSLKASNLLLDERYIKSQKVNSVRWISSGIGAGLLGAAGYFMYSSLDAYGKYGEATTAEDAAKYRGDSELGFNIAIGTAIGGVVGLVAPLFFSTERPNKVKPLIDENNNRIIELEAELGELGNHE